MRRKAVVHGEDAGASAEVERLGRRIIVIRRERGSFERADSGSDFGGGLFGGIFRFGN